MKERPIIFSGEMVRAILEGRKTQTRRVMKYGIPGDVVDFQLSKGNILYMEHLGGGTTYRPRVCPYGQPGDRLWVKETHVFERYEDEPINNRPIFYHKGDDTEYDEPYWLCPHYRATDPAPELDYSELDGDDGEPKCKWRPSIFMPKWASRIMLEVVNVRVERVQEINIADAKAEGWPENLELFATINTEFKTRNWYQKLWDAINAKRGFGWEVNPWVWVIEFKRVKP
jgi:hypothetical protein